MAADVLAISIGSHDIDLDLPKYSVVGTRRVLYFEICTKVAAMLFIVHFMQNLKIIGLFK